MKKFLFCALLCFCSICFAQQQESNNFVHLSQVNQPPGSPDCPGALAICTAAVVEEYIFSNIFKVGKLSEGTEENIAISSRIIIDTTGQVTWAAVKGLPEEAASRMANLLKEMPAFIPGKHNGELANVIGDFKTTLYISETGNDFSEPIGYSAIDQKPVWSRCKKAEDKNTCSQNSLAYWVNNRVNTKIKEPGFYALTAKFVIGADGAVSRIAVHGGGDEFPQKVLKQLKKLPAFEPARAAGAPVAVSYSLPITVTVLKH